MYRLAPYLVLAVGVLGLLLGYQKREVSQPTPEPQYAIASDRGVGDPMLLEILSDVRARTGIPAMSAAFVTSQGLVRVAAVGTRKAGTDVPVTLDDLWHIGSCTKAMTATLTALLVEQGMLSWTTTVSEVFPDLAGDFDSSARSVTVLQLLSHVAGLPENIDYGAISSSLSVRAQRIEAAKMGLRAKPQSAPGAKHRYSNLGYIIVGAIIERVLDTDWETAITQYVFAPLKMSSAGFGGLGTPGQIDQPWGHESPNKPDTRNGPDNDNPPVLGPAGRVHCSIQDWVLFVSDQLRGARGMPGLLTPQSYRMLQSTHFGGDYALGWGVTWDISTFGRKLQHAGSNTANYAKVVVAPNRNFAILLCTNEAAISGWVVEDMIYDRIIPTAGQLKRR